MRDWSQIVSAKIAIVKLYLAQSWQEDGPTSLAAIPSDVEPKEKKHSEIRA